MGSKHFAEHWSYRVQFDSKVTAALHFVKRGLAETVVNALRLAYAARCDLPVSLWIGDSHSRFINQKKTEAIISRAENGHFVWHLGPRLMWSISRRGFPVSLRLAAQLLHLVGRKAGRIVPIIIAGEIDVRCHLASPSSGANSDMSFVAGYVDKGRKLASLLGSKSVIFVVPVPPGAGWAPHSKFPIVGSLDSRLKAFGLLRATLAQAVEEEVGIPRVYLLDATDILVDNAGQLDSGLTTDGCHVNREGALLVHERLAQLVVSMRSDNIH